MRADVASLRNEYAQLELNEKSCHESPFGQFEKWFDEALNAELIEPNAMVLSTATSDGLPSQRTVLLKGFDNVGFTFYTNYESRKGKEIASNPSTSILFPWYALERQIIITGSAQKTTQEQSAKYFHSRPRGSQLGAYISNQSTELLDRTVLEQKLLDAEKEFEGKEIPLPENWGGYLIIPQRFEFWQGRKSRLHDRIQYEQTNGSWTISRLSP